MQILLTELSIIIQNLKKMRCEIQECARIFIKNTLSSKITMSSVKTQAAVFKSKFGVNQHNKALRKQQSLGLRLKKYFRMKR